MNRDMLTLFICKVLVLIQYIPKIIKVIITSKDSLFMTMAVMEVAEDFYSNGLKVHKEEIRKSVFTKAQSSEFLQKEAKRLGNVVTLITDLEESLLCFQDINERACSDYVEASKEI